MSKNLQYVKNSILHQRPVWNNKNNSRGLYKTPSCGRIVWIPVSPSFCMSVTHYSQIYFFARIIDDLLSFTVQI